MKIVVQYFTIIRNITGKKEEALDVPAETNVLNLLEQLIARYGTAFQRIVQSGGSNFPGLKVLFLINGQNTELLGGLNAQLKNQDTLSIIPPLSGG